MTDRESVEQLAARLRKGRDEATLAEAFRRVFDSELGRFVLAAILAEAGLGQIRGADMAPEQRAYHDGRHDMAVTIMNRAGFDQASAAVTVLDLSDELKGRDYERDAQYDAGRDDDGRPNFGRPDDQPNIFDD